PDRIFNFKACKRALKKVNIIQGEMLEEVTSKGGSTKVVLFEAIAKEVEDVVLDSTFGIQKDKVKTGAVEYPTGFLKAPTVKIRSTKSEVFNEQMLFDL
ncbi:hypothetical protein Tco_1486383, partial [Tanacetum coccineum]